MSHGFRTASSIGAERSRDRFVYLVSTMQLLTITEVRSRLRISRACVYALIAGGRLPAIRIGIGRGTIRIDEADLDAFVLACRSRPQAISSKPSMDKAFVHLNADHLRAAWSECE
jgi:excisionase family DNA binding protein